MSDQTVTEPEVEPKTVRFEIRNGESEEVLEAFDVAFSDSKPWQLMSSTGSALHQVSLDSPLVILNIPVGPEGSMKGAPKENPAVKEAEAAAKKAEADAKKEADAAEAEAKKAEKK